MPRIEHAVSHNLGTEVATERIKKLAAETKRQFGAMVSDLEESWSGNTATVKFRAMGMVVSGRFFVEPAVVRIELDIPLAALPFKRRIEEVVLTEAKAVLAST